MTHVRQGVKTKPFANQCIDKNSQFGWLWNAFPLYIHCFAILELLPIRLARFLPFFVQERVKGLVNLQSEESK